MKDTPWAWTRCSQHWGWRPVVGVTNGNYEEPAEQEAVVAADVVVD